MRRAPCNNCRDTKIASAEPMRLSQSVDKPYTARPGSPTDEWMSYREGRFWQPDVTVATVVVDDGRLLMVEEAVGGRLVLNQPAGHLEPDESLVDAALRETCEETGWDVRLTAFVGAYQWKAPQRWRGPAATTCASPSPPNRSAHDPARRWTKASSARCG